jgi:hypothetical protein
MSKKSKSFKSTPIPHNSTSGAPMRYAVLGDDGIVRDVTRAECLDRNEAHCLNIDPESGLVLRMPPTSENEILCKENRQFVWREKKRIERKCACFAKGTAQCPKTCNGCQMASLCDLLHKADGGLKCAKKCEFCDISQSRVVELDKFSDEGDENDVGRFEPADDFDFTTVAEDNALLTTLYAALADLTQEDADLIRAIFWEGKTERQLAPELGLKEPKSVNKRKHRILELLRNNDTLRSFFE